MKVKVKVTQECIAGGRRGSAIRCPIAIAMRYAGAKDAVVGVRSAIVKMSGMWLGGWSDVELPEEAKRFVGRFDHKLPVEPFEFELVLP